jgi:TusA-related sulfurtransferase
MRRPAAGSILDDNEGARFARLWRESSDHVERLRAQREAEFKSREPAWSQEIRIDALRCPLHLQHLRQALDSIDRGQILRITAATPALANDLQSAARQLHLQTSSLMFRGKHFLYIRAA